MVKDFLFRLVAYLTMVSVSFGLLVAINPPDWKAMRNNDYLKALEEKDSLAHHTTGPRIFFAGGSGVAFGTDSKTIGDSLGYFGINLAVHGGMGLQFIIDQARGVCRSGDVLVISPEYYLSDPDRKMIAFVSENIPSAARYLELGSLEKFALWVDYYTSRLQMMTIRIQETLFSGREKVKILDFNPYYTRRGFNTHGDYVLHLGKERPWGLFTRYDYQARSYSKEIHMLNSLNTLTDKGVRVYFVFPTYPREDFEKSKAAILNFEKQIMSGLQFKVLGNAAEMTSPENDFFDTVYHLNTPAREKRTRQIIAFLRNEWRNDR